ncbi:hypothetical protein DFH08DRAFT_762954 [Mycena albidolilacea]|uniref:Novel STAND NTPase 1 domain-containing protein n=1 Tax=Mycena albidolilacea TaxID=1033008 RepID=A0AAD7F4Z8_9AGAR|nr:hypothetical protein DFH08DRAFT_762954 [Mycena albidolilacea]
MENIHQVLYAIINLYLESETAGSLDPAMLDHIGKFMGTLRKIYTFIEAQQDRNKIKYLFRNNEMQNLLKDCHMGLDQAVEVFAINTRPAIANDIGEMKKMAKTMHEELVELIQTLSDTSTSSDRSSVYLGTNDLKNSSNSFSMLPSKPKIFYGRESELDHIMKMLAQQPARIAILGGGGMGKTSLAKVVLHHLETCTKFESRFFVSAESATTSIELAALIGLHIGLDPSKDLTKAVVQYFSRAPSLLLILDNLETVWDPIQSRGGSEEFLSLLTDVEHLTLIITMRGAERPAKVHWTHPFLLPLEPLSDEAAQQTFMDITDNVYAAEDVNQILEFTDNMPLAVDLIAHLSDYEGLSNVLTRWKTEKTALLSVGYDRKSNLDSSITLSLSSPRITYDSKELLSLLSILPDGLTAAQLAHGNLPISNILSCKAALLATSLAYQDSNKQLRSLVPIREHIQRFLPPSKALIQSVCRHFYALLELYQTYNGEQLQPVINQITPNLRNLQEVLQRGLDDSLSDHTDTISCILSLNSFHQITGRGTTILMNYIHPMLPELDDQLNIQFTIEILRSYTCPPGVDPQQLITKAIVLFKHVKNPHLELQFYNAAGFYFSYYRSNSSQAMSFFHKALDLSKLCEDTNKQCNVLLSIAQLKYSAGDYHTAQMHASEAQRLSQLSANLWQEARSLWTGAECSTSLGDFKQSMAQIEKCREILSICGLSGGELDYASTMIQAENHLLKSEYTQARNIYIKILETSSLDQNVVSYATALLNIALIDIKIGGNAEDVYHKLNKARNIYSAHNLEPGNLCCNITQADLELREKNFDTAKSKFLESGGRDNQSESSRLERLADIRAWPASTWQSRWPVIYCAYAYKSKEKVALHKALLFLGDVFIADKDEETATNAYIVALEGFTYMDIHLSRAQCMIRLGDLAGGQGHTSEAIAFWEEARPLFEQSLQTKDVAQIDARLSTVEKAHQKALLELVTLHAPVHSVVEETLEDKKVKKIVHEDLPSPTM